jgi:DnaJ-class molecular chaperone
MAFTCRCVQCWQSECKHVTACSRTTPLVNNSLIFGTSTIYVKEYYIHCAGCKREYDITITADPKCVSCPTCVRRLAVVKLPEGKITDEMMSKLAGHYPRTLCPSCKGTGKRTITKFEQCTNCSGHGGIVCKQCFGKGRYKRAKYNLPNSMEFSNDLCVECSGRGLRIVCEQCNGERNHLAGTMMIPCTHCKGIT